LQEDSLELTGFTPPYTATGRSSLVPPPPWHYAGQVLSIAFEVDAQAAGGFVPPGFGAPTGRAFAHFCEWQATTDGSELLDPVYAQYKEFFVLVEAPHPSVEGPALFCPLIYVDQDISMARGLLQGWPKKLGAVWMTRSYGLEHPAAAPSRAGARLGASLCVKDRRLAEASATLSGERCEPLGFLALPTFGLVGRPTIIGTPSSGSRTLVRAAVSAKVSGPVLAAQAELRFFPGPRDELDRLAPLRTTAATLSQVGLTITGAVGTADAEDRQDEDAPFAADGAR
jgi:hypothetical protein